MPDILIIGGVAAGLSAASRARRLAPAARITVLERGPEAGYSACGLPYFLAGRVQRLEALRAHPPEFFREQRQLQLLTGHQAMEIEPGRRRVRARGPQGDAWFAYDRLVIATGARQRWQPTPGLRNVFSANTWEQVRELDAALRAGGLRRVAVVGGGYIGLETATALAERGLDVVLVHAHADLLRGFEPELTAGLAGRLAAAGIELHLATRVLGLEGAQGGRVLGLETASGAIACDAVVNCGGLRPESRLAAAAGCVLGGNGAVAVDERQQTSVAGILAAGDCAETRHRVTGAAVWAPLGAAANKQGRVAGENAAGCGPGRPARFPGVRATLAVPLAGQEYGRTGLSLEQARAAGFDAAALTVEAASRAGYMQPEAISCRLVYQPSTGRALGVHFAGAPGTLAGRLDTAAAVLTAGLRLEEIEMLDCAYSPALAPLYEPLLIAAHNARRA
ncbi:MAG: FAD-dependent oxidoreductase [Terriglobales bacterium]